MKKLFLLFVCLFSLSLASWAGHDKPIQVSELPKKAQEFLQGHFAGQSVALAKVDKELMHHSYEVIFDNGNEVEFNKKGEWTSVDCKQSQVPAALVPKRIQEYVGKHYPKAKIRKIELTDHKGYEVKLDNGFELEFDKKMNIKDIDR